MRTGARSRIGRTPIVMRFVSGIFLVACLTAQGSRTHADELPQHACALKMPFAMFKEMVSEELQRMLEGIDPDIALHVLGIQITPVLGGSSPPVGPPPVRRPGGAHLELVLWFPLSGAEV